MVINKTINFDKWSDIMKPYYKQLFYIGIAFITLVIASFFLFQIENQSARFKIYPEFLGGRAGVMKDMAMAIIVFVLYLFCLSIWWNSIRIRVIQIGVRMYLFMIHATMLFYIIHFFLIISIYDTNILLLRISGYFVSIPFFFIPIFGYYASLYLGKESVKFTWKEYILLIPAIIFTILFLSSEAHELLFIKIPGEKQPNLQFHTTILTGFVFVWIFIMETMKSWHIYKISGGAKRLVFFRMLPFLIVLLDGIYILPIYVNSLVVQYEVIEGMCSFFLMEILVWESCIAMGMVQVNSYHKEVFDISTVSMQITDDNGDLFRVSRGAKPISKEDFVDLKKYDVIYENNVIEKHISKLSTGYLIWQKDVRELNYYIHELEEIQKKLHNEYEIKRLENDVTIEQAKIKERERIYNVLRMRLSSQSEFVREKLKELYGKKQSDLKDNLGKIILAVTYIKRYGNLYLLTENSKYIYVAELRLCFAEIKQALDELDIKTDLEFNIPENENVLSSFCLECCNIWQHAVEYLDFKMSEVLFLVNPNGMVNKGGLYFIISIIKGMDMCGKSFVEYINNKIGRNNYLVYETSEGLVIELEYSYS